MNLCITGGAEVEPRKRNRADNWACFEESCSWPGTSCSAAAGKAGQGFLWRAPWLQSQLWPPELLSHGLSGSSAAALGNAGTALYKHKGYWAWVAGRIPWHHLCVSEMGCIQQFRGEAGYWCGLQLETGMLQLQRSVRHFSGSRLRTGCVWWSCISWVGVVSTDSLGLPRTFNGVLFLWNSRLFPLCRGM